MYIYGIMHPYAHCLLGLWGPVGLGLDLGGNAGRAKLFLTLRTDAFEHEVVPAELKAVGVAYRFLQIVDVVHIDIEYPAALRAPDVVVVVTAVVEPVGRVWDLDLADLPALGKLIEVAIYSCFADVGVLADDRLVDLFGGGVTL